MHVSATSAFFFSVLVGVSLSPQAKNKKVLVMKKRWRTCMCFSLLVKNDFFTLCNIHFLRYLNRFDMEIADEMQKYATKSEKISI